MRSGPAERRQAPPGLSDGEIADRLRETFRYEADAVAPFAERLRSIPSLDARRARTASLRRRALGAAAAVALVGAGAAVTTSLDRHPTASTVVAGPGGGRASPKLGRSAGTERPATAAAAVPASFVPVSVTFDPTSVGWVLGTVRCAALRCLDLAHTTDSGATWSSLGQPQVAGSTLHLPASAAGLDLGVRFGNDDGWIYGTVGNEPLLWSTTDDGASWSDDPLPSLGSGAVVDDLETANGDVQVVALTADPSVVHILTAPIGSTDWTVSSTRLDIGAGARPSPDLVLQQTGGWLVEDNPDLLGAARLTDDGTAWTEWSSAPCAGTHASVLLAASDYRTVVGICDGDGSASVEHSTDGGTTFTRSGKVPSGLDPVAITATSSEDLSVGGTRQGDGVIAATSDGGRTWSATYESATYTDVRQLGFETDNQGVAVVTSAHGAELLMTTDGGARWKAVDFRRD